MKKPVFLFLTILLSMTFVPTRAATVPPDPITEIKGNPEDAEKAKVLLARLEEIKAMDKSALTRVEKRELRKEVRDIKSQLRATGNGIYLSVGAIIIIILLLILLL